MTVRAMARWTILTLVSVLTAATVAVPTANSQLPHSARVLRMAMVTHHQLPANEQLRLARKTVIHANSVLVFLRTHRHAGTFRVRQVMGHNHLWLRDFGAGQRDRALARLATIQAAREATALPAHYAGWHCITYGAYAGAPHEGHGYNGPYSGPLQMTTPWMGQSYPWASMSDLAVYQVAEHVAAAQGFSYSFMAGQWPATFPPCAGFF